MTSHSKEQREPQQERRDQSIAQPAILSDGPGIPAAEFERVFHPFVRLDTSRNPSTGGVGLGLTIARDVARSHGGDVSSTPRRRAACAPACTCRADLSLRPENSERVGYPLSRS